MRSPFARSANSRHSRRLPILGQPAPTVAERSPRRAGRIAGTAWIVAADLRRSALFDGKRHRLIGTNARRASLLLAAPRHTSAGSLLQARSSPATSSACATGQPHSTRNHGAGNSGTTSRRSISLRTIPRVANVNAFEFATMRTASWAVGHCTAGKGGDGVALRAGVERRAPRMGFSRAAATSRPARRGSEAHLQCRRSVFP